MAKHDLADVHEKKAISVLLDPLSAIFCAQLTVMTPGAPPNACQTAVNAASIQTNTTATMNQLQSFLETNTYKIISKNVIYGTAGLIYVINSINTKSIAAQIPIKPFEIDTNLNYTQQSVGIKYKYEF